MDEEDPDTTFLCCISGSRRNIDKLHSLIPRELDLHKICHESSPGTIYGLDPVNTRVLGSNKRFILLWQTSRVEKPDYDSLVIRPLKPNLAIIDMLENKYTEFLHSGKEIERCGFKPSVEHLMAYSTKRKLISDTLLVLVLHTYQNQGPDYLARVALCSVLMSAEDGTFDFYDLIMLQEKPMKCCGNIKMHVEKSDKLRLLVHFSVGDGQSMTRESHYYEICNNQFIFIEKNSVPVPYINCSPPYTVMRNVFDKKRYEFKLLWKVYAHLERRIVCTDYTRVIVHDLEQPSKEPQRLQIQCEYEELKAVPTTYYPKWSNSGIMFVPVYSQSMQHYRIYCFNAQLLRWNKIEWLQCSVNHVHVNNQGYTTPCQSNEILHVISPNTFILKYQFHSQDRNQQVKSHRIYYRLTVGRPDTLCDLTWSKVQASISKNVLHSTLFNKFQ